MAPMCCVLGIKLSWNKPGTWYTPFAGPIEPHLFYKFSGYQPRTKHHIMFSNEYNMALALRTGRTHSRRHV